MDYVYAMKLTIINTISGLVNAPVVIFSHFFFVFVFFFAKNGYDYI